MKTTVSFSSFADSFNAARPGSFSYDGLRVLFDYLREYEESTGEELELDVIAFCSEFFEYNNIKEFNEDYGSEYESYEEVEGGVDVVPIDDNRFIVKIS